MAVPPSLLLEFFQEALKALDACEIKSPQSFDEIRSLLLSTQRSCLEQVVAAHNQKENTHLTAEEVQNELKALKSDQLDGEIKEAMDKMNDGARLAFCRLVLYSECLQEKERGLQEQMKLNASGKMERSEILEFCGLCSAAVRLPNVQNHLKAGTPLFDDIDLSPAPIFPQKRLEFIQRTILRSLGYDAEHGMSEIKRIFFTPSEPSEFSDDKEVLAVFQDMVSNMNVAITNANMAASQPVFSDQEEGGVTRVVSVTYSEKIVDSQTGQVIGSEESVPSGQTMEQHSTEQQREQLRVASQAAMLQQEILGELFSMPEEERDIKLAEAKQASDDFMQKATEIPAGQDRIAFLRSIDSETQRLMAMHKLWEGMLVANGGKPPVMRHQSTE